MPDSRNLTGDLYVNLINAASVTTTLKVAPGVTNPVTRHPAVTATSVSTIQAEPGRRATTSSSPWGGALDRIEWAKSLAQEAGAEHGRDPAELDFGTLIPVAVHPDRELAHTLITNGLASVVRFSVMHGKVVGPVSPTVRDTLLRVYSNYDMNTHARRGRHSEKPTPKVIDTFGIAGPPGYVVERLQALRAAGLRVFWAFEPNHYGVDESLLADCHRRLVDDVLPHLR